MKPERAKEIIGKIEGDSIQKCAIEIMADIAVSLEKIASAVGHGHLHVSETQEMGKDE